MTEEEAEQDTITPEVLPSTQLATIIKETKLDQELADEFKINFEEHFRMASEWSKKAKAIIVTNENQTVLMEQARVARLFIRSKRLEIENFRKSKKEYYLRGGQAVDKVCTFLKNMIEPIENHLDLQEHYVEYKKKAEDARLLAEAQAKAEEDRIAEEKHKSEENARLQAENERLRNEQKKIAEENSRKIAEENRKRQEELARVQAENKVKLDKERAEREKAEAELFAKRQAEARAEADRLKKEADRIRAEEALLSADDQTKMVAFRRAVQAIYIPEVESAKNKTIIGNAVGHLYLAVKDIQLPIQEEE